MKGLYQKYHVEKIDGETEPDADYFVLRLDKDPCALGAALSYARCIESENPVLAQELRARVNEHLNS